MYRLQMEEPGAKVAKFEKCANYVSSGESNLPGS